MEISMAVSKQQNRETKTVELSEAELSQVSGGIIAVLQQNAQMGDGSVRPVARQTQNGLIGLL
jgi:bacteriocin-like protein